MQALLKSVRRVMVLIAVAALAGCQKGGETTQPTAAVAAPTSEKASQPAKADAPQPQPSQDPAHPVFEIDTTAGKITVRLDAEHAPLTVDNFRNYVEHKRYDLTIFHQVLKGPVQIVLGGGYTANLIEKTAFTPIRNEAHNGLKNRRGTIAMARRAAEEDSATSQFFFNITDNDVLNFKSRDAAGYGYCVFGKVTDGMAVLDRIAKASVHDSGNFVSLPVETVAIKTVRQIK